MSSSFTATFDTRRDADLAVERLVQEFGVERTDIFIAAAGPDNSAGVAPAGSDSRGADQSAAPRDDGAHNGGVSVSVDVNDDSLAQLIKETFDAFSATTDALDSS